MSGSRAYAFFGLTALGVAAVTSLLLVSVTRWFLPGVVELSAALAVAGAAAAVAAARNRSALIAWAQRLSWRSLRIAAAGVAVLVLSAGLALAFDGFPWPVALLAGTVIVLIAAADGSTAQATGGANAIGGDPPPAPSGPAPAPVAATSFSRRLIAHTPAFARQLTATRPPRRSPAFARHPRTVRPARTVLPRRRALPCYARSPRYIARKRSPAVT